MGCYKSRCKGAPFDRVGSPGFQQLQKRHPESLCKGLRDKTADRAGVKKGRNTVHFSAVGNMDLNGKQLGYGNVGLDYLRDAVSARPYITDLEFMSFFSAVYTLTLLSASAKF